MNTIRTKIFEEEFNGTNYDVRLNDIPLHLMHDDDIIDIRRSDSMNSTTLIIIREFTNSHEQPIERLKHAFHM